MKKLFVVLFCSFVMSGYVFADELSYEIDPVATAKAPWKVGEIIIEKGNCWGHKYYRKFLGVTQSGLALVQDFYLSNEKLTDPYLMSVTTIGKTNPNLCWDVIDGNYTVWYENGQKEMERNFKNGNMVGIWRAWGEKGNLIIDQDYGTPTD